MIATKDLRKSDVGRYVIYTDGVGDTQKGRIKTWNDCYVFVVYYCANDWVNYLAYGSQATDGKDLEFEVSNNAERVTDDLIGAGEHEARKPAEISDDEGSSND